MTREASLNMMLCYRSEILIRKKSSETCWSQLQTFKWWRANNWRCENNATSWASAWVCECRFESSEDFVWEKNILDFDLKRLREIYERPVSAYDSTQATLKARFDRFDENEKEGRVFIGLVCESLSLFTDSMLESPLGEKGIVCTLLGRDCAFKYALEEFWLHMENTFSLWCIASHRLLELAECWMCEIWCVLWRPKNIVYNGIEHFKWCNPAVPLINTNLSLSHDLIYMKHLDTEENGKTDIVIFDCS